MTKESLYVGKLLPVPQPTDRYIYNDEQTTKFKSKSLTGVTFSNGNAVFNGAGYIGYSPKIINSKGFSIRTKINITNLSLRNCLFGTGYKGFEIHADVSGYITIFVGDGSSYAEYRTVNPYIVENVDFEIGISFIKTNNSIIFYINGEYKETLNKSIPSLNSGLDFGVGSRANTSYFVNGSISFVELYRDNILTAEHVANLYNNSFYSGKPLIMDVDDVNKSFNDCGGTGTYVENQISVSNGEKVVNGDFSSGDLTGWSYIAGNETATIQYNTINPINGIGDARIIVTEAGTSITRPDFQNTLTAPMIIGKRYRIVFDTKLNSGHCVISSIGISASSGFIVNDIVLSGVESHSIDATLYTRGGTGSTLDILFEGTSTFDVQIDNVSIIEIPPLKSLTNGSNILTNTVAGTKVWASKQAYGTWEFDLCKQVGTSSRFQLISSKLLVGANNTDGYYIGFNSSGAIYFYRANIVGYGSLFLTSAGYINFNTWYRIKVTRSNAGVFTVYIKGGDFGEEYVLISVTGGTGSNPVTDNTHKTSNFFVLDLDADDKTGNIELSGGIR